jgi:ABC-type dipeptide/oligopeptide/nickel transport system ATPase component
MRAVGGPRWLGLAIVMLAAGLGIVLGARSVGADAALLRPLGSQLPLVTVGTVASPLLSVLLGIGGGLLAAWHSEWMGRRLRTPVILGCSACLLFMIVAGALWFAVRGELGAVQDDPAGRAGVSAVCTLLLPATAAVFGAATLIAVSVCRSIRRVVFDAPVQTTYAWGLPATALVVRRVLRSTLPTVLTVIIAESAVLYAGSAVVQAVFTTPALAESLPLLPVESLPVVLAVALLCVAAILATGVPLTRALLSPPSSPLPVPLEGRDASPDRSGSSARVDAPALASPGFRSADFLDIRDLRLSSGLEYGASLTGLDLTVSRGQALAVVGDDGDGASLLCHAIAGLLPLNTAIASGSILFDGTELVGLPERAFRRLRGLRIGFLAAPGQHRLNPDMRIGQQLDRLVTPAAPRSEARASTTGLLTRVGIEDAVTVSLAYPHQVSEATAQRVLLAAAVARGPDLLIADDPGGRLAVADGAGFLDVLHDLRREHGFTLIVASAGIEHVKRCDRVAVLNRGSIVEHASAHELLTDPQHPHSRRLLGTGRSAAPGDGQPGDR